MVYGVPIGTDARQATDKGHGKVKDKDGDGRKDGDDGPRADGAALADIFREVRAIGARPLPAAELATARDALVRSLPGQFDTNRNIIASLAATYVYGFGPDYYAALPRRYAGVTAAQMRRVARRYLAPRRLSVIGVGHVANIAPQLAPLKLAPLELRDADKRPR